MDQSIDDKAFAEQNWIARYLGGRLSDAEAELFEQHWARNPALIHEIEMQARLQDGFASLQARGELERAVQRSWWGDRFRLMALAAALAVIGVSSWLWMAAQQSMPSLVAATRLDALPAALGRSVSLDNTYHLLRLRSAAAGLTLRLPPAPSPLQLRVLPETLAATGAYRIGITQLDAAGAAIRSITVEGAQVASDGFLDLYLDSSTLQPGRYRVSINPVGDGIALDHFDLQVIAPDTAL